MVAIQIDHTSKLAMALRAAARSGVKVAYPENEELQRSCSSASDLLLSMSQTN